MLVTRLWDLSNYVTGAHYRGGLRNMSDSFAVRSRINAAVEQPAAYRKKYAPRGVADDALPFVAMLDGLHARGLLLRLARGGKTQAAFDAVVALAAKRLAPKDRRTLLPRAKAALAGSAPSSSDGTQLGIELAQALLAEYGLVAIGLGAEGVHEVAVALRGEGARLRAGIRRPDFRRATARRIVEYRARTLPAPAVAARIASKREGAGATRDALLPDAAHFLRLARRRLGAKGRHRSSMDRLVAAHALYSAGQSPERVRACLRDAFDERKREARRDKTLVTWFDLQVVCAGILAGDVGGAAALAAALMAGDRQAPLASRHLLGKLEAACAGRALRTGAALGAVIAKDAASRRFVALVDALRGRAPIFRAELVRWLGAHVRDAEPKAREQVRDQVMVDDYAGTWDLIATAVIALRGERPKLPARLERYVMVDLLPSR